MLRQKENNLSSLNLLTAEGISKLFRCGIRRTGERASIDFEEVIAAPAIFMIISQRFDIEHDMTRRARRGKEGKKCELERRKYNDAKQ